MLLKTFTGVTILAFFDLPIGLLMLLLVTFLLFCFAVLFLLHLSISLSNQEIWGPQTLSYTLSGATIIAAEEGVVWHLKCALLDTFFPKIRHC